MTEYYEVPMSHGLWVEVSHKGTMSFYSSKSKIYGKDYYVDCFKAFQYVINQINHPQYYIDEDLLYLTYRKSKISGYNECRIEKDNCCEDDCDECGGCDFKCVLDKDDEGFLHESCIGCGYCDNFVCNKGCVNGGNCSYITGREIDILENRVLSNSVHKHKNWWVMDDVFTVKTPKSLKEFDPRQSQYHLLLKCKIKHIGKPKSNSKFKRYEQKITLYSQNSKKEIKSIILGDEVFFEDEYESGDTVVVIGDYFSTHDIPFQIHKMKRLKKTEKKKSREQENPEYKKWRNSVVDRDKVCQCCGDADNLEAHHYFGYANNESLQVDVGNGVALCKWCHGKYHSKYGYGERVNPATFNEFVKNHREGFR